MSKIFTRTFRVRFSECNAYGQAGIAHLVRYLVETALNTLSPRLWGLDRASVPYEGPGERKTLNLKH